MFCKDAPLKKKKNNKPRETFSYYCFN